MFEPTRDQARQFLFDTWRKYRDGVVLSGLENVALQVISAHPEYHKLLESPERHLGQDYAPHDGGINPFLHLSLHLAIEEQLTIDQPPGIRAQFTRIAHSTGSEHDAQHALLECLAETLWQAQRLGTAPDHILYLACAQQKFGKRPDNP